MPIVFDPSEECDNSKAFKVIKGFEWLGEVLSMPAFWIFLNAADVVFYPLYHLLCLAGSLVGTMDLVKYRCCQIDDFMIPQLANIMEEWKKVDGTVLEKCYKLQGRQRGLPQNEEG